MGLSSSSSKTSQTTNSTSSSTPYNPAQPLIDSGLTDAQSIYAANQGNSSALASSLMNGYNQLAGSAFSPNPYVTSAQGVANGIATAGANNNPGASTYSSIINSQNPALSGLSGLTSGGSNSAIPGLTYLGYTGGGMGAGAGTLSSIASGAGVGAPNSASGYDNSVLSGAYLNSEPGYGLYQDTIAGKYLNNNPYIDSIAQQATDAATKSVNQRFGSAGLGSGLSTPYTDVLAKDVADASNNVRYQNYNDERTRQLTAASQADAAYANERNNQESTSGRVSSNYNAAQDRALSAANGLQTASQNQTANALSGLGLLSGANQNQFTNALGANTALGSLYNQGLQTQLGAATAADSSYNAQQQQILAALGLAPSLANAQYAGVAPTLSLAGAASAAPWDDLNSYINALNGLGGKYGTVTNNGTTAGTTTTNMSPLGTLAGLAGTIGAGWASGGFKT